MVYFMCVCGYSTEVCTGGWIKRDADMGFWTECVWMGCVEDVGLIGLGFIYVSCTSVICTRNPFGRFWMGSAYSLCMIRSMQHFS